MAHRSIRRKAGDGCLRVEIPTATAHVAAGDTSFISKNGFTWNPGDSHTRVNLYGNAVRAIDNALANFPGSEVVAVLWHQGETGVPLMSGSDYQSTFDRLIGDLRRRAARTSRS